PRLAGSRNVDVLQAALHQAKNFVTPAFGLDEAGVFFVGLEQPVLKLRQRKIITGLAALDRHDLVVGTPALLVEIAFRLERFAAFAVQPLVTALVDGARIVNLLDELPAAGVMARFAGLDEIVVADLQGPPYFLELP